MTVSYDGLAIDWLGYATVRIASKETVVYIDPGRYGVLTGEWTPPSDRVAGAHPPASDYSPQDGDLVCVTHLHHYDPDGIRRVTGDGATVVTFEGINTHRTDRTSVRPSDLPFHVRTIGPESDALVDDVPIWTVSAYNEPDGPHTRADGTPIHPEGFGCGYLLSVAGTRVFFSGDTDVLDGHAQLDVNVFLPPIGGTFTMNRRAAADLAAEMAPDLVVPVHYNTFERIEADSDAFAADLEERGLTVALDEA